MKNKIVLSVIILLSFILFLLIPTIFIATTTNFSIYLLATHHILILLFIFNLFFIAHKLFPFSFLKHIFSFFCASIYLVIYFSIIYTIQINQLPDISLFLDNYTEFFSTAIKMFGIKFIVEILLLIILEIIYYLIFLSLFNKISDKKNIHIKKKSLIIIIILIYITFVQKTYAFLPPLYIKGINNNNVKKEIKPFFPNNDIFKTNSDENIFILQLESGNSMDLTNNDMPYFSKIAKDGILFKNFFGNSMQTSRAQTTILCGIINNINQSFSYRPKEIPIDCMPSILKKSGYKTILFRSDDLGFANTKNFMIDIGFEEIHYKDIMKKNDKHYDWGYDDCIFYKRSFEYLKENYPNRSKLFIYFEVSSHHLPFKNKKEYSFTHKFNPPKNDYEIYVNSYLEQDYCLSKFYEEFKNYNSQETHLFITPDTAQPIGLRHNYTTLKNAFNENIFIPMAYIPANNSKNIYKTNNQVDGIYSQSDIMPTIFDLLNNQNYQNSFGFELKKNYDHDKNTYENCHIFSQPYNEIMIVVLNNLDKYIYNWTKKTLIYYDLEKDWEEKNPSLISDNLSYNEFKEKYYCNRYK